jgi:hypothetical protein
MVCYFINHGRNIDRFIRISQLKLVNNILQIIRCDETMHRVRVFSLLFYAIRLVQDYCFSSIVNQPSYLLFKKVSKQDIYIER